MFIISLLLDYEEFGRAEYGFPNQIIEVLYLLVTY